MTATPSDPAAPSPPPPTPLTVLALIAANTVPAVAVLVFGWDPAQLLVLYWLENVVIGLFNVPRMLMAPLQSAPDAGFTPSGRAASKAVLTAFFAVHYGLFMTVHLVLLGAVLARGAPLGAVFAVLQRPDGALALLGLAASHGFSFFVHYVRGHEFKYTTTQREMTAVYPRIVVLHVAILAGAALLIALQMGGGALLTLVLLKTVLDVKAHRERHARPVAGSS